MKEFNAEKFCSDLIILRGKETQDTFAQKLGIKRSTLSLLENGKQVPTIDILGQICNMNGKRAIMYTQPCRRGIGRAATTYKCSPILLVETYRTP